jgi:hypothetical protein
VATDERVDAHKDRTAHPRLWHARTGERVRQRERRERAQEGRWRWQHASVVVLYEGVTKANRVVRPRVRCSTWEV